MTKVTTRIERNSKAKTKPSEAIFICMNAVNRAIWGAILDFNEEIQMYIEHISIKILLNNDGETPHSVVIEVKIVKGSLEKKCLLNAFDPFKHHKSLEAKIREKVRDKITEAFEEIISGLREEAMKLSDELSS